MVFLIITHNVPWLLPAPARQMYNIFCLKASMPGLQKIQVTCWAYFFLFLCSCIVESSYEEKSVEEVKVNREFECRSIFIVRYAHIKFLKGREILLFFNLCRNICWEKWKRICNLTLICL